jgi:hypothetical protein
VQKAVAIGGGIMAGAAMLGIGMAVGAQVGQQQALIAAADAQGPLTSQDRILLRTFSQAADDFDALVARARKGKQVGDEMTREAVTVLNVKRLSASDGLRNAADATAQAMLLIGAGISTNDQGTVQDGVDAYREAQQKLVELARELNPDANIPDVDTGDPAAGDDSAADTDPSAPDAPQGDSPD